MQPFFGKENTSNIIALETKHCLTECLASLSVGPWGMTAMSSHLYVKEREEQERPNA